MTTQQTVDNNDRLLNEFHDVAGALVKNFREELLATFCRAVNHPLYSEDACWVRISASWSTDGTRITATFTWPDAETETFDAFRAATPETFTGTPGQVRTRAFYIGDKLRQYLDQQK